MKRIITALILALVMIVGCFPAGVFAANEITLTASFEQRDEGMFLHVSGVTPAKYEQRLFVVAYDPQLTDGLGDLLGPDGKPVENPAEVRPMNAFDDETVLRMVMAEASKDGVYDVSIPIGDDIENGQYMIVQVAGGGYKEVGTSTILYYETPEHLEGVTLKAFNEVSATDLDALLKDKQFLLGMDFDDYYETNKVLIGEMFIEIRDADYAVNPDTMRKINKLDDVSNIIKTAYALIDLKNSPTKNNVANFVESFGYLINYDFTNNDYKLVKDACHGLIAGMFAEDAPSSMTEVASVTEKCVGLAVLNTKNATTVAPTIEKYGVILGIDWTDYEIYCEEYGAYEVSKAFVNKNFTKPTQVLDSLNERIRELEEGDNGSSGSSGGSSGGGGGGGLSGGSSSKKEVFMGSVTAPVTEEKEETGKNTQKFSDMDENHWAYEPVAKLSDKGVVNGFADGSFLPDAYVTREQFVKMLVSAFELDGVYEGSFKDVDKKYWSASYISVAAACGIVMGNADGYFLPAENITRQDAAVMLERICGYKNISLGEAKTPADGSEIASYAYDSVSKLYGAGIITGFEDGSFRPYGKLTRAQAAKLIHVLMNK